MALQVEERWESREGSAGKNSADRYVAIVWGDPDADQAEDPAVVEEFFVGHVATVSELSNVLTGWDRKHLAPGFWEFSIDFGSPTTDRQTNDASFSFTTGGGSTHITNSIKTVQGYGDPSSPNKPPNYNGAIGVTDDGVEGVDIHTLSFDFKTTFYVAPEDMTAGYIQTLKSLTGKVNSDLVTLNVDGVNLTFQPGELLFLGADGSKRHGYTDWELTCNWSASENATNLSVGPITNITKNGWDYLWVRYRMDLDANTGAPVKVPDAVYVEQVYTYKSLNPIIKSTSFGIGNSQFWTLRTPTSGGGLS